MATDEQPSGPWTLVTAAAYWMLSMLFLAAAIVSAILPIEFNDTRTSVLDGFHRYLTKPYAGSVRWGFGAMVALLLGSAVCSVLAVAARGERTVRNLAKCAGLSLVAVLAVLLGLWFVAPPAFPAAGKSPQPGPPASGIPRRVGSIPLPPTTVPPP